MKGKIFALLFSLSALASQSQTINGRLYTQFNNYYKWRGGAFDSVLLLPNLTATAGLRGGALRYNGADSSLYVWTGFQWRKIGDGGAAADSSIFATKNWTNSTFQPIGSYLTSVPTLQQVTNAGNTTTTNILKTDGFGRELVLIRESANRGQVRIFNPLESGGSNNYTTYERHGISYMGVYNTGGLIAYPDSTAVPQTFVIGAKLNGEIKWPSAGGVIDLGTISASADSAVFPTTYRVDTAKANLRSSLAAKENVLTFNSPLTRSSNTIGLDTTSGKWRSENYYNTKFQPIGSYLTAADSLAMLDGRISGITLNTSGAIHTNPITFSRVGGAWSGTMSLATQSANRVFAGPSSGSAATPTFRALVEADMPNDYARNIDTISLVSFGAGSGASGDTAAFSTSAVYGSFYNDGSDTLIITQLRAGVLGTSPSITTEIYWNDSLNITAGATILVSGGTSVTGTIGATNVTSFTNNKIPPGNWVFCRTSAVATKPTYFTLTLIGYKKRK